MRGETRSPIPFDDKEATWRRLAQFVFGLHAALYIKWYFIPMLSSKLRKNRSQHRASFRIGETALPFKCFKFSETCWFAGGGLDAHSFFPHRPRKTLNCVRNRELAISNRETCPIGSLAALASGCNCVRVDHHRGNSIMFGFKNCCIP